MTISTSFISLLILKKEEVFIYRDSDRARKWAFYDSHNILIYGES